MYVDYSYYQAEYSGTFASMLDETSFYRLQRQAERIVEDYTEGRYKLITDQDGINRIKECMCVLVDSICQEKAVSDNGKVVVSESVDSHSRSYAIKNASTFNSERNETLRLYLQPLGIRKSRKVYGY